MNEVEAGGDGLSGGEWWLDEYDVRMNKKVSANSNISPKKLASCMYYM